MNFTIKFLLILGILTNGISEVNAVVNGSPFQKYEQAIVRIIVSSESLLGVELSEGQIKKFEICTGTFISSNHILTAGHCVFNEQAKKQFLYLALRQKDNSNFNLKELVLLSTPWKSEELNQEISPGSICSKPGTPLFKTQTSDIAVLETKNYKSHKWLKISSKKIHVGDKITFAGYGIQQNPYEGLYGIGLKNDLNLKSGENKVRELNTQRISFKADIMQAFAADGDSGSPILIDGKIAGVMSTVNEHCETEFGEDYGIMNTATIVNSTLAF